MRFALHPIDRSEINAEGYKRTTDQPIADENDPYERPDAFCAVCSAPVHFVAELADRAAHFRHYKKAKCPTQSKTGEPYLNLRPKDPDPAAGARLKASFRQNWIKHYLLIDGMLPFFAPEEFTALIARATEHGLWDYRGFSESRVPYSLVLTADFPPWTSTRLRGQFARRLWFRFWYTTDVQELEDLWIRPREKLSLQRASFLPPRRKGDRPSYDKLLKQAPVPINFDFLTVAPYRSLRQWESDAIERWFDRRRDFR